MRFKAQRGPTVYGVLDRREGMGWIEAVGRIPARTR